MKSEVNAKISPFYRLDIKNINLKTFESTMVEELIIFCI